MACAGSATGTTARSGFPVSNVYDGGTGNTYGNSYVALSTLNAWVQLDFGSVLTVTGASFYGVNDGDQADTVSIVCGNFPSYQASGAVYMAGTDTTPAAIPRTNSYTGITSFYCQSQYMAFYFHDAHAHASNVRVAEIFLYTCPSLISPPPPSPPLPPPAPSCSGSEVYLTRSSCALAAAQDALHEPCR